MALRPINTHLLLIITKEVRRRLQEEFRLSHKDAFFLQIAAHVIEVSGAYARASSLLPLAGKYPYRLAYAALNKLCSLGYMSKVRGEVLMVEAAWYNITPAGRQVLETIDRYIFELSKQLALDCTTDIFDFKL